MMISDATSRGPKRSARKRVGRGRGCGWGKTSGRGAKGAGQHATRSNGQKATSEGGQLPLFRRLPKRGFSNAQFRTEYQVVNVSDLQERFEDGAHITATLLKEAGLIHDAKRPVKILGDGQISKRFQVEVTQFSQTAAKKIADAGGQAKAEAKVVAKAEGKVE